MGKHLLIFLVIFALVATSHSWFGRRRRRRRSGG